MVGNCFYYDFVIVVVLCFEGVCQCIFFQIVGYCESIDVICFVVQFWCNKICQIVVGKIDFFGLLVQVVVDCQNMSMGFVVIDFDVIVDVVCWEQVYYVMWI